jgi:hypothetical protein
VKFNVFDSETGTISQTFTIERKCNIASDNKPHKVFFCSVLSLNIIFLICLCTKCELYVFVMNLFHWLHFR